MPNNVSRLFDNLTDIDPLHMRPAVPTRPVSIDEARSVIDPYHPANNVPHNDGRNSTYTFRQRNMKLNLTLGWELEANHMPSAWPAGVDHINDGSVDGHGAEYVVMPAVTKSPRYVLGLLKDLVHRPRLNTNESCGFHIHVSASNLASAARMKQWAIATEHLASLIEDLAFKAVPDSRRGNSYCKRIVPIQNGTTFQSHKYNNDRRYHWLNIVEMFRPGGIRTIEVRLLGHTHRWKYLLAWSLFSMELARRGWDIANKPFEVTPHVDALSRILINIEKEIKPLSKKTEPIPQWVYDGLKTFGIEANAWDRPLGRLSETETDLRGLVRQPYSDEQPEERMPHNEDECECGCGNEGRCDSQVHSDGDCDSNYCEYCHEDVNCSGSPSCESCRENRHDNGEDCGRRTCPTCHPRPVSNPMPVASVPVNASSTGWGLSSASVPSVPPRMATVRQGTNAIRNTVVDYAIGQVAIDQMVLDSVMYGQGMAQVDYDGATHVPQTFVVPTSEREQRAYAMLDTHDQALSINREFDYDMRGGL